MAISPQRHTIYLYSAHRAVIFAIAQLSCLRCRHFDLCSLFSVVFNLSSVLYFPALTNVNGTVWPYCADAPLRIYSLSLVVVVQANASHGVRRERTDDVS